MSSLSGKTILDTIMVLSTCLRQETATGEHDDPIDIDSNSNASISWGDYQSDQMEQDVEDDDVEIYDDWAFDEQGTVRDSAQTSPDAASNLTTKALARQDCVTLHSHGFKFGHIGDFDSNSSCFLSVAVRISKMGIPEEAVHAWGLQQSNYLVLLLHYPNGYKSFKFLTSLGNVKQASHYLKMAVRVGNHYRPLTAAEALLVSQPRSQSERNDQSSSAETFGLGYAFTSDSLDALLNERLFQLIRFRSDNLSWSGAEKYYDATQGLQYHSESTSMSKYRILDQVSNTLPGIVTADHYTSTAFAKKPCFPLLAMQFLLRHFVGCTDFCMVCYGRMGSDLGAIKPYVCDKPLCLYQYMSLGMGPNIEHEIINQPWVIDLLISFTYAAAKANNLTTMPLGLSLKVPGEAVLPQG